MLSRRRLLLGSGCALAAVTARTQAEAHDVAPDMPILYAGKGGFNGGAFGPLIRIRQGDDFRARLVNGLGEPVALYWHGVRASALADDRTPPPAAPGASIEYRFIVPDAGAFWYRATRLDQQQAGLYGPLIVAERSPPPADRDHVLLFNGRPGPDGAVRCTVNGNTALDLAVRTNERLRLRFINASATMLMNARIEKHQVMVMALDGEPAEPFMSHEGSIILGPGNRADVFVDATMPPGSIAPVVFTAMAGSGQSLTTRLVYGDTPARSAPLAAPALLPANPLPERMDLARALRITLPMQAGSGTAPVNAPNKQRPPPLFVAERRRIVVMALDNRDAAPRVVHIHGHHFRLLDRLDDGWKPYWLDTVTVRPQQTERIAFVADMPGRWRIEDRGIDGTVGTDRWFEVK